MTHISQILNAAVSTVENFILSAPSLAASNMVAPRMGASEPSKCDRRYHTPDDKVDIRRSVPGEPEIDYPIFNSVPDTSFSCKGITEGMCLKRL